MPLLGTLFVNLFSGLVAWFTTYVTRKIAFGLAAVAAYGVLTVGMFVAYRAVLAGLNVGLSGLPAMFVDGLAMGVPPVAPACVSAYVTMWTACTVYTWQRDLLHLVAKV